MHSLLALRYDPSHLTACRRRLRWSTPNHDKTDFQKITWISCEDKQRPISLRCRLLCMSSHYIRTGCTASYGMASHLTHGGTSRGRTILLTSCQRQSSNHLSNHWCHPLHRSRSSQHTPTSDPRFDPTKAHRTRALFALPLGLVSPRDGVADTIIPLPQCVYLAQKEDCSIYYTERK